MGNFFIWEFTAMKNIARVFSTGKLVIYKDANAERHNTIQGSIIGRFFSFEHNNKLAITLTGNTLVLTVDTNYKGYSV